MNDAEKLSRIVEIIGPLVRSVIEDDFAWEETGLSYDKHQELYKLLRLDDKGTQGAQP